MADEQEIEQAPKRSKKWFIIGGLALVLIVAGAIAVPMLMGGDEPDAEAEAAAEESQPQDDPAIYSGIHPPLLINFLDDRGRSRFLQISLEVMSRDQAVIDALDAHNAVIRNNLILLYGDIKMDDLSGRAGKAKMLEDARAEINAILEERTGEGGIEAVYFTNLVVQ